MYPFCRIPYEEWVEKYIEDISCKSFEEVKDLLRCMLGPINRQLDFNNYDNYIFMKNSDNQDMINLCEKIYKNEVYKRIEKEQDAWEGLTWVLELLPFYPYKAIQALQSYSFAQDSLPDDRITGISQCIDIIIAKFISFENPLEKLTDLKPIEFEWLIEELYKEMGYETEWTSATRDGGKDIIAKIMRTDGYETVYVECKRYKTTDLKLETVRAFSDTVKRDNINRGVMFCTGYVNDNLKKYDNRIQVWSYEEINILLNAHLGSDWTERLERLIENQRRKYKK